MRRFGDTDAMTGTGLLSVMVPEVLTLLLGSVAVTAIVGLAGNTAGAVYSPPGVMVPDVAEAGERDQIIGPEAPPDRLTPKERVPLHCTVKFFLVIVNVSAELELVELGELCGEAAVPTERGPLPQPVRMIGVHNER